MHTVTSLLDTATEVNVKSAEMMRNEWKNLIKWKKLPKNRTETKQPIPWDRPILLRLHLCDLRIKVWFQIAPSLAVGLPLGASSVDSS